MTLLGVVLAGGASRRMGRDKVLERLGPQTLLARAVERLDPQVDRVVVNGPAELEAHCDRPVVPDALPGRQGPLAGVLAAMDAAGDADAVLTVAVDTPFFPRDLAERLRGDGIAIAASGGRLHPVFALWPVALRNELRAFLHLDERKIMLFAEAHGYRTVDFDGEPDPFFNLNTPADVEAAHARLATA